MKSPLKSARFAFWISAAVVAHTLWTSAAPSMIYPLYAAQWKLTMTVLAVIFGLYPLSVVLTMLLSAGLSDRVGRKRVMLAGLASSAAGVLLFAVAGEVSTLMAGRVMMGIGVGLSAGPSAAALVDYAGKGGAGRAASVTLGAQSVGFAGALLLAGALVTWAPAPTRLSFYVLFVLLLLLFLLCLFISSDRPSGSSRLLARPQVPRYLRRSFIYAALAIMGAYTHGVMIASLGAQVARSLIGSPDAWVNSLALALFPAALGIAGGLARKIEARRAIVTGSALSVMGMACLCVSVSTHSLACFVGASLVSGAGYAFMTFGGLAMIAQEARREDRGNAMSMLFVFAYLFTGGLAIALGKTATSLNLSTAVYAGALILTAVCLGLIVQGLYQRRSRHPLSVNDA
ncbi:MFS transporter [Leclercia adecarboxylata]|uniref:MFS transporter n=1 Tax=Leclercia adecarboxylata TaxID=83655 RepID=UPI002029EADF|nr:MFS transporter [Leclercia adecarboxylata]URO01206.1 MFS transporter [Leclercia adecarboxylata]